MPRWPAAEGCGLLLRAGLLAVLLLLGPGAVAAADPAGDVKALVEAGDNDLRGDALLALLKAHQLNPTIESFDLPQTADGRSSGRNFVVTIGEGPRYLLLGAHYDAARLRDGSLSKGAVDNAGSAAMLVHLAAALQAEPLPVQVRIAWFDMEEVRLTGSQQYARRHAGDLPFAMLNYDINAYGDTILFGPPAGAPSDALKALLLRTCVEQEITCLSSGSMPAGDDRTFGRLGIPTLSIATLPAVEAHQVWLLVNGGAQSGLAPGFTPAVLATIHTPGDVLEKVEPAALTQGVRLATALLRRIASGADGVAPTKP